MGEIPPFTQLTPEIIRMGRDIRFRHIALASHAA